MSPTKVIFTYKRKRLSSCSSADHAEICHNVQVDKRQDPNNGRSESREDLKYFNCINCGNVDHLIDCKSCLEPYNCHCPESCFKPIFLREKLSSALSSQGHKSSIPNENNHVEESDMTGTREMIPGSNEFPGENKFKTSVEHIPASQGKIKNSSEKDMDSSSQHVDGCIMGALTSQSVEKDADTPPKESELCNFETGKAKLTAPLLTFTRRFKRKANAGNKVMFIELPIRQGSEVIKESKSMSFPPCSCEVIANKSQHLEEPVDLKVVSNESNRAKMLGQTLDEVHIHDNFVDSMGHTREKDCLKENLNVGASSITEHTTIRTQRSIGSSSLDVLETRNNLEESVRCSLNDGTAVSFSYGSNTTDDHHVSPQLRTSSGNSQLTTSDVSIPKAFAGKAVELKVSSGASIIDCNVIPECDIQEEASHAVHHSSVMVGTQENTAREKHLKDKGLELFGDTGELTDNLLLQLPRDVSTSVGVEAKSKSNFLQLFPEDSKSGFFPPASADSEIVCSSKADRHATFALDSERDCLERSSSKVSASLGLSLPTEPLLDKTLKHGSSMQTFQECNARSRGFIQNPDVSSSFPASASLIFRHRMLLDSINTKATALRGNRNISLDKFEPCPSTWTEEELDSLWIGIRRHGRGNWHAMLLDPRLRFAPWRVARDLAGQWEREQYKLLSEQHMPHGRYSKPPDPYCLDGNGGLMCPPSGLRGNVLADTQLSLGDVYAQKETSYFGSGAQSFELNHPPKLARTSGYKVGNYSCDLFNKLQNNVSIRGDESPDGPAMGLASNSRWFREPIDAPSRSAQPTPLNSTLAQMGAPWLVHPFQDPPGTWCRSRNMITNRLSGLMAGEVQPPSDFPNACLLTKKQGTTGNLIVIDSDASSEETISDDHNIRC